jgi:hypothetical protein
MIFSLQSKVRCKSTNYSLSYITNLQLFIHFSKGMSGFLEIKNLRRKGQRLYFNGFQTGKATV